MQSDAAVKSSRLSITFPSVNLKEINKISESASLWNYWHIPYIRAVWIDFGSVFKILFS